MNWNNNNNSPWGSGGNNPWGGGSSNNDLENSIKKAKELLKYNPKVEIEEGLRRTYQYYLDHPSDDEL